MRASYHGYHKIVNVLLKSGAKVGRKSLMMAVCKGHDKIVNVLLKNGVKLNAE